MRELILFTDLDGTLLDSSYSFQDALPALKMIDAEGVSLILCSSKTRTEIEHCRKQLNNEAPFISENGGGIFLPKENPLAQVSAMKYDMKEEGDYLQITLGARYDDLRSALEELRSEGFDVRGFGDMSVEDVADLTGLQLPDAERAVERDFDEPFVFNGDAGKEAELKKRILEKGFRFTQGEFFHIMGDSDKGRAVDIMKDLYAQQAGEIKSAAFGDSPNDIEMLQRVDHPVVVQKKDGSYHPRIIAEVEGCIRADGVGPIGWNKAVIALIQSHS